MVLGGRAAIRYNGIMVALRMHRALQSEIGALPRNHLLAQGGPCRA
jgi:hypothetical protein